MKDYLVVVDANYPSGAKAVIDDVKKISAKPIRYLIDTHADADHAYGNSLFTKIGAITIAHVGVLEDMKQYEPQAWQRVAKVRKDVAELQEPGPEPPKQTYRKSPYVIEDSTRRLELYNFGWGHTRGDTYVFLPKEKILCTGDAVPDGFHNDPKHSYMRNWPNQVRLAKELKFETVLPGHGKPGGRQYLDGQIRFLTELYAAVEKEIQAGKTLDQIVTMKNGQPVATTVRLPDATMDRYVYHGEGLQPWQTGRFPNQVMVTYKEIRVGKPYGQIFGRE
jgi:glyoxylase-like metal-dependent hydrolase (beta-lactamase superfamily II)